jgi:hypothetical protein
VAWDLAIQKGWKHVRQLHLACVAEISVAQLEVLAHHRELDALLPEDAANLA